MRPAYSASLELDYPDERRVRVVERSVAIEEGEIDDARFGAHVACEGRTAVVTVGANDLVVLRAGVNSWIRLVETTERVASVGSALSEFV